MSYDILGEIDKNDGVYYLLEKWNDKAGLDEHMATAHFKDTIAAVNQIIDGELEIHVYQAV